MDRVPFPPSAETEIRFLLSLLHIASPGEPESPQTAALEQLASLPTR